MYSIHDLKKNLMEMDLDPSGTILVHSSMKSIGTVENRAEGVLDALSQYFAPGLLCFPTLSWDLVSDKQPVFSVRDTPCTTGILPELFRQRPDVQRSLCPTHSLAALGNDAENFVAHHEDFDSPAPRNSPWGRLYDRHATILFIGCSISHNTFLHGVEEWLPVPGMLTETHQNLVIYDKTGRRIERPMRRHVGDHSQWYDKMEGRFQQAGGLRYGRLGDATVAILDAKIAGDVTYALLQQHPLFFTNKYQLQHTNKETV